MIGNMYRYNANVVRVYDGDTVWADIDLGFDVWLKNHPIRLSGIDTPELRGSEKEAGIVSRARLIELLDSADNQCVIKTTKGTQKGMYGRILAEIFIEGEVNSLNQILLSEGLAEVYS